MGESQQARLLLYLQHQRVTIELSAERHHGPIVESNGQPPLVLRWADETATADFARHFAQAPALAHALLTLHGNLGAGKTSFVRHLLRAMGVQGRIKSPTYALAEIYELPQYTVWHFDFYRFNDPREWEEAGLRDTFASRGLKIAEWPEKAAPLLPVADLEIHLEVEADDARSVQLKAHNEIGRALIAHSASLAIGQTNKRAVSEGDAP